MIESLAKLAAELLVRLLEADRARRTLEERIQVRKARREADELARRKFGI